MSTSDFAQTIAPFFWVEHENSASLCLEAGAFKTHIFIAHADEGFDEGGGYDWAALAAVYLAERAPQWAENIHFDPEGSLFVAYSDDPESLRRFALAFRAFCDDEAAMHDLLTRAEAD